MLCWDAVSLWWAIGYDNAWWCIVKILLIVQRSPRFGVTWMPAAEQSFLWRLSASHRSLRELQCYKINMTWERFTVETEWPLVEKKLNVHHTQIEALIQLRVIFQITGIHHLNIVSFHSHCFGDSSFLVLLVTSKVEKCRRFTSAFSTLRFEEELSTLEVIPFAATERARTS